MQWLANMSVRRPVFATVLVLLVLLFGIVGYRKLGVDRFPDVDFPTVAVITELPGAAPEEVESEVSTKIEEAVNTVSGIDELRSTSSEGVSQVYVSFVLEKDVDLAAQEVRDRVNRAMRDLPRGTEPPAVMKLDPDATPILYLAVKAEAPIPEITEIADKLIRRRLESVNGVGQVMVLGGSKRQINVWLDASRLRAFGVTALDVERAIASSNLTSPGGRVESGPEQQLLRVHGRVDKPAELAQIAIAPRGGRTLRVGDVARVEDGIETPETSVLRDGRQAVVLSIRKQSGANSVAMVDDVRQRMRILEAELPPGYSLDVVRDSTGIIRTSVSAVSEHLLAGAIFAGLVVLLFLGSVRSTLIAALAIPVSIIGTFTAMWLKGFSLDTITLLALALAVGIVIDDAIVVLENIHRFIEEKGVSPVEAAILASREIGLAVLATTLSLVAVFVPVALMSGIVGRFLKSFGLTMAFSILLSMLVSFTLTPMLCSRWLKARRPLANFGSETRKPLLERVAERFHAPIERGYVRLLSWVMRRRWVVLVACLAALASTVPLMAKVPKGFLPKTDEAQFEVNLRAQEGTSLEATTLLAERVARRVRSEPEVERTLVTVGDNTEHAPNAAIVYVELKHPTRRKASQQQVMDRVRKEIIAGLPKELRVDVSDVPMFTRSFKNTPIMYEIGGPDLALLQRYSDELARRMKKIDGAVDVTSSLVGGKPELGLRIDRDRAADLGVAVSDVVSTLATFVGGREVSQYQDKGESYAVRVRGELSARTDLDALSLLSVPSSKLGSVPLFDVARSEVEQGPASIMRLERRRQVVLYANLAPGAAQGNVMKAVEREIKAMNLPAAYHAGPVGQSKEMGRAGAAFVATFLLALVFMYLVLAAQFESWLHPISILLALPLTLPFALTSLLLFGLQLDIYSMLGILVLFGVVKKNAILQIDYTNQLRRQGMDRLSAILEANRGRLRPILMTTFAFVAGMLPLVFSSGIGAGFSRATGGVVVGGQLLSLLLTLLATPVAYSFFDDASAWWARRFGNDEQRAERDRALAALEANPQVAALGSH